MAFLAGEARAERCQIRFFDDDIHFFDDDIPVVAGGQKVEMMLEIFLRNR